MPKTITAVEVMMDNIKTKMSKSEDYQGDGILEEDYFPYGHKSYITMLNTKLLRIVSVSQKNPEDLNYESLVDSLRDLSVYAAMYSASVQNGTTKEDK